MRVIDLIFLFAPASAPATEPAHSSGIQVIDFLTMMLATLGLGGIWFWYFAGQLAQRPLVPVGEPDLEKALAAPAGHH